MSDGVNNFLDAASKLVKVVPSLYEDLAQDSVRETGKFIARVPKVINAAFIGVDCWIEEKNYRFDETKKLIAHKLQNVDPDKIVTPELYVAIPALQAISYSMDSSELRELYANLLAKAMNVDTKDSVHPCFIEFIRQMTPLDCQNLEVFRGCPHLPIVRFDVCSEESSRVLFDYVLRSFNLNDVVSSNVSISNLIRLGLITVDYTSELWYDYDRFKEDPLYIEVSQLLNYAKQYCYPNTPPYGFQVPNASPYDINILIKLAFIESLELVSGSLKLTSLGENFINVCYGDSESNIDLDGSC